MKEEIRQTNKTGWRKSNEPIWFNYNFIKIVAKIQNFQFHTAKYDALRLRIRLRLRLDCLVTEPP